MRKFAAALLLAASALAADQDLLKLVMPEARVVSGVNIARVRSTPFGRFLLAQLTAAKDKQFDEFVKASGFDPSANLDQILVVSPGVAGRRLVLARGSFDPARIVGLARGAGVEIGHYRGIEVIRGPAMSVAFLGRSIGLAGDPASVNSAIARRESGPGPAREIADRANAFGEANDVWFVSILPFSEFASALPGGAGTSEALKSVQQVSGGVKFGESVQLSAEFRTRSAEDAANLAAALRSLAALALKPPALDSFDLKIDGGIVRLALALSEAQAESLFQQPPK
jgi:hypothetical protein